MRILQLCKKFPYPPKDGESIAITYLARALAESGHEVHLLSMNTSKHYVDIASLPTDFDHYSQIKTVDVDNRLKPVAAFFNLFSSDSYHIKRFVQPQYADALRDLMSNNHFDAILLETVYLAPYVPLIRTLTKAKVVMRAHNVEHEIWERLAQNANVFTRFYLNRITPRLRDFEVAALNTYDLLAGITQRDVDQFRALGMRTPAVVLPVGLDTRHYMADQLSFEAPLSIGFIGSLDWMPNIEGLRWFLDEVWQPLLRPQYPQMRLHIAGRNTPDWLRTSEQTGIVVHGEVPDAAAFIKQHSVMVVPLLSGGGMRVKILEGMALGRVNLTTTIGLEGIDAEHTKQVLIADTPQDFVNAITFCHKHPARIQEIGLRAQVFCASKYDNLKVVQQLLHAMRVHEEAVVSAVQPS
jgi:polysaccharide biosynthesis protein PslH